MTALFFSIPLRENIFVFQGGFELNYFSFGAIMLISTVRGSALPSLGVFGTTAGTKYFASAYLPQ
jgi:hypothetical protein